MTAHWCRHAVVGGVVRDRVLVAVEGGRVASIDTDADQPAGARRHEGLTLPGFANAHSHVFHRALRGRSQAGGGSFWTWREQMYAAATRLDPDRFHRLARATFAEMALAGVTAVGEFHYVHHQPSGDLYADPNAMAQSLVAAAGEAGIRLTLLDTIYLHGGLADGRYAPLDERQRRFGDGDADRWIERVEALDRFDVSGPVRLGAAVHSVRAVDPVSIGRVAEWAGARGVPVHVHASEQRAENDQCVAVHGATPIEVVARAGLLGPRCTVVHAVHVDDADVARLASSGTTVCCCPTTERDLADGIAPTPRLSDAGVPISLGTDSHAVIDLFEEARGIEMHARLASGVRGVHGAADLLASATVVGHRSLGWDDAGELAVGRRADLVTIDLRSVRTAGAGDDLPAAMFAATAGDVTDVVVDGRDVVTDGRHLGLDVAAELTASIEELYGS